jgi:hypothetical protein
MKGYDVAEAIQSKKCCPGFIRDSEFQAQNVRPSGTANSANGQLQGINL